MKQYSRFFTAFLFTLTTACAVDDSPPTDDDDDSTWDAGKADSLELTDGTNAACAVLQTANTLSKVQLRQDASVGANAATNIVAARPFTTIASLDEVSGVGNNTLLRLHAYGTAHGFVCDVPANHPFDPASCTGQRMSPARALQYFAPAATTATIGAFHWFERSNVCHPQTGCTAWSDPSPTLSLVKTAGSGGVSVTPLPQIVNGNVYVKLLHSDVMALQFYNNSNSAGTMGVGEALTTRFSNFMGTSAELEGELTETCARLEGKLNIPWDNGTTKTIQQVVLATIESLEVEEICADAERADEDNDGAANCDDSDCASLPVCEPTMPGNWSAAPHAPIPDNVATGVSSTISSTDARILTKMQVRVKVSHPYRGDLVVQLTKGAQTFILHDRAGGGADNLDLVVDVPGLVGQAASGTYVLTVSDLGATDVGTFEEWALEPTVQP